VTREKEERKGSDRLIQMTQRKILKYQIGPRQGKTFSKKAETTERTTPFSEKIGGHPRDLFWLGKSDCPRKKGVTGSQHPRVKKRGHADAKGLRTCGDVDYPKKRKKK